MSKSRNYELQRNYYYDSHDANGNFNGLTEQEWKEQIRKEWSCENLKADLVVLIFHYANNLHVHAIVHFNTSITRNIALYRSKCSKIEDCLQIDKKNIANRYKYLLHIDKKSIKLQKHIYGQNELEIYTTDNKKFNYNKIIACADEAGQEEANEKKLLQKVLDDIKNDVYSPIFRQNQNISIYEQLLLDENIYNLMLNTTYEKKIKQAIQLHEKYKIIKNLIQ